MNLIEKILSRHLTDGKPEAGSEVSIKIDQTLTQDATGTMVYLQLEALNPERLVPELAVSYVDHNTVQAGYENFDDHRYLESIAAKYGIYYSRAGNGICHQVHLERFSVPGKTLLGSDSHTPTSGGMGMFAVGAGGLDVASAMAGGLFTFAYPKIINVRLSGRLAAWVSAKDIVLRILQILSSKGNAGCALEYSGPGVSTLTVPQRATITNMGAETGVTTSVFPSDGLTETFLRAQGREEAWIPLEADPDSEYARAIEIDLSEIVPLVAQPHNPDNVTQVKEIEGLPVDQVVIGSCTNSSYRDLMTAAAMLKGVKTASRVSFVVAPGSRQVLRMIADNDALSALISAGARVAESACGFCIGNSQAPGSEAVSIRTSNRNFEGRSGTKSARLYLTSVETAVASAIRGVLTDPRTLALQDPLINDPDHFLVDDSMIVAPRARGVVRQDDTVAIIRGPNIAELPQNDPLTNGLKYEVALKAGDKITTDHIMPAGDKLKYRSNVPKYAQFVFAPLDETFSKRAAANREKGIANIIIGGQSYGQGSSREHAALCPMYLGVKLVAAKSFERIHKANLVNFGILPCTFMDESDYERIEQGDGVEIPKLAELIRAGQPIVMHNLTKQSEIRLSCDLSEKETEILLLGGKLNYLKRSKI